MLLSQILSLQGHETVVPLAGGFQIALHVNRKRQVAHRQHYIRMILPEKRNASGHGLLQERPGFSGLSLLSQNVAKTLLRSRGQEMLLTKMGQRSFQSLL